MNIEVLNTLLDLGTTGMLLYFLGVVWRERKEESQAFRDDQDKHAASLERVNDRVLDVVERNIQSNVELKEAITRVDKTLTERIYKVLDK